MRKKLTSHHHGQALVEFALAITFLITLLLGILLLPRTCNLAVKQWSAGPPLLADGTNELGLAHPGAAVDAELGGLAPKLCDGHRSGPRACALRGTTFPSRRLRPFTAERSSGLARKL